MKKLPNGSSRFLDLNEVQSCLGPFLGVAILNHRARCYRVVRREDRNLLVVAIGMSTGS